MGSVSLLPVVNVVKSGPVALGTKSRTKSLAMKCGGSGSWAPVASKKLAQSGLGLLELSAMSPSSSNSSWTAAAGVAIAIASAAHPIAAPRTSVDLAYPIGSPSVARADRMAARRGKAVEQGRCQPRPRKRGFPEGTARQCSGDPGRFERCQKTVWHEVGGPHPQLAGE